MIKKKIDFSTQVKLLESCNKSGQKLADALESKGLSYDDLSYRENPKIQSNFAEIRTLDDFRKPDNSVPVVSFFSGAGGLDLGFEAAGFEHLALVEHNELFCETLRLNRPEWEVIGPPGASGDVSDFDGLEATLSAKISGQKFDGIFIGGPPCQPFSIAANQRFSKSGKNFKRIGFAHETNGNLLFEYIDLIIRFKPRAFLIENVPGLLEVDGGEQLQKAYAKLESAGYRVNDPMAILASEHYVPQQRARLFIIGSRSKKKTGGTLPATNDQLACGALFSKRTGKDINHITRDHSAESILRYMELPYGSRDQLGRVDRLDPRLPSKTVIAGGNKGGGRSHLHPFIPRTLSVRECARIQTFPDSYVFTGPVARQFTQVGNAVPPVLGAQLAALMQDSFY